jgi:hypothetical protein
VLWYRLEKLQQASRDCAIPAGFQQRLDSSQKRSEEALNKASEELSKVRADAMTGKLIYVFWGERRLKSKYTSFKSELDELDKICSQLYELQTGPAASFLRPEFFKLIHETIENQPGEYLPLSDIWIANGNYQSSTGRVTGAFVLEKKYRENDIRFLCNKLMEYSPSDGILKCLGYRQPPYNEQGPPNRPFFQVVMELPDEPRSSLAHRIDCETPPPLDYRLDLSKKLSRAVCHVHDIGLVHKSIRPRAILLIGSPRTQHTNEQIYLQDWTYVRETTGATSQLGGDHSWQLLIYQHPDRQGRPGHYPEVAYDVKHDLYSLGVTFLELFLWTPFIERADRQTLDSPVKICQTFEARALALGEGNGGVAARYAGNTEKLTSRPTVIRNVWADIASHELAAIDPAISQIVLSCVDGQFATAAEVLEALNEIHI